MSKMTNKFSSEVCERAVRLVLDHEKDRPSRWAAVSSVASKISCSADTLNRPAHALLAPLPVSLTISANNRHGAQSGYLNLSPYGGGAVVPSSLKGNSMDIVKRMVRCDWPRTVGAEILNSCEQTR